jgi:hypothetical protein
VKIGKQNAQLVFGAFAVVLCVSVAALLEQRFASSGKAVAQLVPENHAETDPRDQIDPDRMVLHQGTYAANAEVGLTTTRSLEESVTIGSAAEPAAAAPSSTPTQTAADPGPVVVQPQPHLPAAFLPLPSVREWNVDDVEAVAGLARQFTNSVGGPSQNPWDEKYYERWLNEERLVNEQYRSYFGSDAFNALRASDE